MLMNIIKMIPRVIITDTIYMIKPPTHTMHTCRIPKDVCGSTL